jgi:hypothetical protein
MAPGCPERIDLGFLRWVWRFRRDVRPKVLEALLAYEAAGGRVVTLTSRRASDAFLRALADGAAPVGADRPATAG